MATARHDKELRVGARVIQAVMGKVPSDARVRRTARSLRDAGFDVVYLGIEEQDVTPGPRLRQLDSVDGLPYFALCGPGRMVTARRRLKALLNRKTAPAPPTVHAQPPTASRPVPKATTPRSRSHALAVTAKQAEFAADFARAVFRLGPDLVHAHDLPAFRAVAHLGARRGIPVIYDAHELERGRNNPGLRESEHRFRNWTETATIGHATRIVTVCDAYADILARDFRVERPVVVNNAPPATFVRPNSPLAGRLGLPEGARIILYLGRLTDGRGLDDVVAAMPHLPDNVHLVTLGSIALPFRSTWDALVRDAGPAGARIHALDRVPYEDLLHTAWGADVGFCGIQPVCESYRHALPNKFFEYAFTGAPIVSTRATDVVRLIDEYALGELYTSGDATALLAALTDRLVTNPGRRIAEDDRRRFLVDYSWEAQERKFLDLYARLLPT